MIFVFTGYREPSRNSTPIRRGQLITPTGAPFCSANLYSSVDQFLRPNHEFRWSLRPDEILHVTFAPSTIGHQVLDPYPEDGYEDFEFS